MENLHADQRNARLEVLRLAIFSTAVIERSTEEIIERYDCFISLLSQPEKTTTNIIRKSS